MTAKDVISKAKADKCYTASRSTSKKKHGNYSNKYTQLEAGMGYPGYDKKGYFTKFYSYGVVGHCAIFVQYWLIKCGYGAFVPKSVKYIFNTNVFAKWLKSEPTIKGYGKITWTKDPAKAKPGAVCFKGPKGKGFTHTMLFEKYENGKVYTIDGNVKRTVNGKKINNGAELKRTATNFSWGFANMPYEAEKTATKPATTTKPKTTSSAPYVVGKKYKLTTNMNIRASHSTKSKKLGTKKKGKVVTAKQVYKTSNGTYWIRYKSDPAKWLCAKSPKKTYLKGV